MTGQIVNLKKNKTSQICQGRQLRAAGVERGSGPAQICRIYGFVKFKTNKKMPQFRPKYDVISKKRKKAFTKIWRVFPAKNRCFPKKKKKKVFELHMLISQRHFDGPPKHHGPRGHCLPWPPLGGPASTVTSMLRLNYSVLTMMHYVHCLRKVGLHN